MSWFTFRDLFLRCHLRPICAPALSVAGFARDQLSHAITAARLRRLTRSLLSRLLEKRRTRFAWSGSSESDATEVSERAEETLSSGALQQDPLTELVPSQCGMEAAASGAGQDGARMVGCADPADSGRTTMTTFVPSTAAWQPKRVYMLAAALIAAA